MAAATKTRRTRKTNTKVEKIHAGGGIMVDVVEQPKARKGRKPTILGLPIEGSDHKTPRTEIKDLIRQYGPDTKGEELPEPSEKLSPEKQMAKDQKWLDRQQAKREREQAKQYHGAPIPATKVYRRKMEEFKNCEAECWMLINEITNTYTFANTYNGQLKASYNPEHYTYALNEKAQKKIDKKAEQMIEVEDREEWPTWITPALPKTTEKPAPKRGRKSAK